MAISDFESQATTDHNLTIFSMIDDNLNRSLEKVYCSPYTRRIALKEIYHRKRKDIIPYTPVEYNFLETLAETFIIPARQNQFIRKKIFNKASVRRIAIAMKTNSAFTASYTENLFLFQQFYLRQTKTLRGGQPIVDFDAADICRIYFTTMIAINFKLTSPQLQLRFAKTTM